MEQRISLERMEEAVSLFGSFDENIRLLENEFHVSVVNREEQLIISGEPEDTMLAGKAIEALLRLISRGESVGEQHVRYVVGLCRSGQLDRIDELTKDVVCISAKGRPIKPKTIGQKDYIKTIQAKPVTIGVGPAGTGKTYLAVAAAVSAFREKEVSRIILTRPAVEAGERLGFLPGDLQSKVDPYLRPLYDALFDMLGPEPYQKYLEKGGSKVVITGDVTQIDLPSDKPSGLKEAMKVLDGVEGVGICRLTQNDVVRHIMVQRIIEAYARFEEKKKK